MNSNGDGHPHLTFAARMSKTYCPDGMFGPTSPFGALESCHSSVHTVRAPPAPVRPHGGLWSLALLTFP